jgi:AcrR family transcriptional regulator
MSIFPLEKRERIRTTMLEVGTKLIKQEGMQNLTVSEVSKQTGIGKGTFYHFYKSKEIFIYEVILYNKENIFREINRIIEVNDGINRKNFKKLFYMFSFAGENNIISSITMEDEIWLAKKLPKEYIFNLQKEEEIVQSILDHTIGCRENINYHVLANMMKIIAIAVENKELLHQDVLAENISLIFMQLLDYVFEEGEK